MSSAKPAASVLWGCLSEDDNVLPCRGAQGKRILRLTRHGYCIPAGTRKKVGRHAALFAIQPSCGTPLRRLIVGLTMKSQRRTVELAGIPSIPRAAASLGLSLLLPSLLRLPG